MGDRHRQQRIEEIFNEARKLPASQLDSFLDDACGDDAELGAAVEKLLAAGAAGEAVRNEDEIEAAIADRNLLFGIVALHMNFIDRDALIRAMNAWVLNKTVPIEEILVSHGEMGERTNLLLTALVDKHLEHHDGRPEQSLAALNSNAEIKKDLEKIEDSGLQQSLSHLKSDSFKYVSPSTVSLGSESKKGGRFRILRPHKEGGLGAVHVALDEELNREVALKEVKKEYAEFKEARDRLQVEAEITGGLEHPGIVPVYGLGSYQDGKPFYCMRFIRGDSLKDAIKDYHQSKSTLSPSARNLALRSLLRRFIDVCDAIGYAHSRHVLHRDLKPGNIMLGKHGETLVVDWGLAKATGTAERDLESSEMPIVPRSGSTAAPTIAGSTIGTPEYMSPEQAEGRIDQLGPATDVYSLGATLYCLLTGRSAFKGKATDEVLQKVRRGDFAKPREIDATIPKALEAVCLKAMAKKPGDRYPSPTGLAQDLDLWMADEPIGAFSEPWTGRAARALRKNRAAATTLSAVVMTAIIGLIAINTITQNKNSVIQDQYEAITEKNTELSALNKGLAESRDEISRNYATFRKLTAEFIQKAENEMSQDPKMASVRRWLTQETLEFVKSFRNSNPVEDRLTNDLDLRIWLAQLYRYNANLDRLNNRIDDALAKGQTSIDTLEEILIEKPDHKIAQERLSETLRDFANTVKKKGRLQTANKSLERALQISDELRNEDAEDVDFKRLHATNLVDAADVKIELGEFDIALDHAEIAEELLSPIVDSGDQEARAEQILVLGLQLQSKCLRELQKLNQAVRPIESGLARIRRPASDPNQLGNRITLALTLLEKARVQNSLNQDFALTKATVDEAIDVLAKLAEQLPQTPFIQRFLAEAMATRAMAYSNEGLSNEASADFKQALDVVKSLLKTNKDDPAYLETCGEILVGMSRLAAKTNDSEDAEIYLLDAIQNFQNAVERSPENKRLQRRVSVTRDELQAMKIE